jgi:lactoylglutathione lyase
VRTFDASDYLHLPSCSAIEMPGAIEHVRQQQSDLGSWKGFDLLCFTPNAQDRGRSVAMRPPSHHIHEKLLMESGMTEAKKARAVGVNHVALEVGDIEEALAFYGRLFEFKLRGKGEGAAFIDLGDQFIALQKGRRQPGDDGRHFGLVVDDKEAVRKALAAAGVKILPGRFLDFLDPWGNRIEIVGYENIQFSKAPNVLRGMRLSHLSKNGEAIKELTEKGMAPD